LRTQSCIEGPDLGVKVGILLDLVQTANEKAAEERGALMDGHAKADLV